MMSMRKSTSRSNEVGEVAAALRLVLVSLDSILIPGIEAEKMKATRKVVEDCIIELEGMADDCESDPAND